MEKDNYLPTFYQQFIFKSRYAKWIDSERRRETWPETVTRYFDFFEKHLKQYQNYTVKQSERKELEEAVLSLKIMPSMRCIWSAGPALERDNISGYNCAYVAINRPRVFDEILYVLMNGTGVGYSVERQYVSQLPVIAEEFYETETTIVVADSKIGWAKAFKELISLLYTGQIPQWDLSKVRPAGSRLKTFGGRASGPDPLDDLFRFSVSVFSAAEGRKLSSIECHDIVCKIAEVVVVGGVRRSSLISLSNLSDDRMRQAKSGRWWDENGHRALANISVAYTEKPDIGIFMNEWLSLYESKSGERGIFNRQAAVNHIKKLGDRRDPNYEWGCNPCSEILLRDREFCNLTEVIVRETDSQEDLKTKVRLASILGTWQATLTNFKYISKEWTKNCEEEALLGVSLTGIMDSPLLNKVDDETKTLLQNLKSVAVETNKNYAKKLKINPAAAVTTGKPSGTISQLTDSASGIHARHNDYYIRTVRADNKDPLCKFMKEKGFPWEPDVTKPEYTSIFSFPHKSPDSSITRNDRTALEQLEHWLMFQDNWTEHKPSVTINVKEHEWFDVGAWVWNHFDDLSGVSFLPSADHNYKQAPYQDCKKEDYQKLLNKMPMNIDWEELHKYEYEDMTSGSQELSCTAGVCELVDLTVPLISDTKD